MLVLLTLDRISTRGTIGNGTVCASGVLAAQSATRSALYLSKCVCVCSMSAIARHVSAEVAPKFIDNHEHIERSSHTLHRALDARLAHGEKGSNSNIAELGFYNTSHGCLDGGTTAKTGKGEVDGGWSRSDVFAIVDGAHHFLIKSKSCRALFECALRELFAATASVAVAAAAATIANTS